VRKNLDLLGPLLGPRKLRLFCCALYRLDWGRRGFASVLDLAERFADGRAEAHELAAVRYGRRNMRGPPAWAVCWPPDADPLQMTQRALSCLEGNRIRVGDDRTWTDILEDIAGHLLRPCVRLDPAWLAWGDGTVGRLARVLYEERDFERLPILADALDDAGCTDAGLLDHLRNGGTHVLGCWAVDEVLIASAQDL
jgi:hypothetical protein